MGCVQSTPSVEVAARVARCARPPDLYPAQAFGAATLSKTRGQSTVGTFPDGAIALHFAARSVAHHHGQDRVSALVPADAGAQVVGVFDGHGRRGGSEEADAASESIPKYVLEAVADGLPLVDSLKRAFAVHQKERVGKFRESTQAQPQKQLGGLGPTVKSSGGTTATVVALTPDKLAVAWVGDSRAALLRLPDVRAPAPPLHSCPTQRLTPSRVPSPSGASSCAT